MKKKAVDYTRNWQSYEMQDALWNRADHAGAGWGSVPRLADDFNIWFRQRRTRYLRNGSNSLGFI